MRYIAGLSSALIPVCVILVLAFIRHSADKANAKMTNRDFCVQIPKAVFFIGMLCTLFFLGISIYIIFFSGETLTVVLASSVVFGLLAALGIYLMILTLTHKIIVKDNEITVFSAFKKPYSFTFDDIVSVQRRVLGQNEKVVVKTSGGKKVSSEMGESAYDRFVAVLKVKVRPDYLKGF